MRSEGYTDFNDALRRGGLVLDGATGVLLGRMAPAARCFDVLNISRPDLVAQLHRRYLECGADIIETNTFRSNVLDLKQYGYADRVDEINRAAAAIARREADGFMAENGGCRCYVGGSIGPTAPVATLGRESRESAALVEVYREQATALILGGVDVLMVETCYHLGGVLSALRGIELAANDCDRILPVTVSLTASSDGRILSGHDLSDILQAIEPYAPSAVGFNCCGGPAQMRPMLERLAAESHYPIIYYPNAGMPDKAGRYRLTPAEFAGAMAPLLSSGLVAVAGGCCGVGPEHIAAMKMQK